METDTISPAIADSAATELPSATGVQVSSYVNDHDVDDVVDLSSSPPATQHAATSSRAALTPTAPPPPQPPVLLSSICISVADDRLDSTLPYHPALITRLVRCIVITSDSKALRPMLRLLSTCARYKLGRRAVLGLLVAVLIRDAKGLRATVASMATHKSSPYPSTPNASMFATTSFNSDSEARDLCFLLGHIEAPISTAVLRRIVFALQYTIKKTDKLSWLEIMQRVEPHDVTVSVGSTRSRESDGEMRSAKRSKMDDGHAAHIPAALDKEPSPPAGPQWMFGQLTALLGSLAQARGPGGGAGSFDSVLALIEELASPLCKLSPSDVRYLLERQGQNENTARTQAKTRRYSTDGGILPLSPIAMETSTDEAVLSPPNAAPGSPGDISKIVMATNRTKEAVTEMLSQTGGDVTSTIMGLMTNAASSESTVASEAAVPVTVYVKSERASSLSDVATAPDSSIEAAPVFRVARPLWAPEPQSTDRLPTVPSWMMPARRSSPSFMHSASSQAASASSGRSTYHHNVHTGSAPEEIASYFKTHRASVLLPFPVLADEEAAVLAIMASHEDSGQSQRRKISRILKTVSLADSNWRLLLSHLASSAAQLAAAARLEIHSLHAMLQDVVTQAGDALFAMSQPALATPSSISELRLLHVLRLMTTLRGADSVSGRESDSSDARVVTMYIQQINFGDLWDLLSDCLDLVRGLEGIVDEVEDEDDLSDANANSANPASPTAKGTTLSSLTMRFVPLVECYLSVSGLLLQAQSPSNDSDLKSLSTLITASTPTAPGDNISSSQSTRPALLPLPGARFRTKSSTAILSDPNPQDLQALRLYRFAQRNHVLINMILKNNISLLESSFAPLITLLRCRCLLHFDVKRGYFKMKLKRMRLSVQRHLGALRISVRRRDVFQDSFEQLRYKSTEEMRRRLSITFVGEEGLDAGGLTREWYTVLAREVFNPNYGLFIGAGDTVTFQPNPSSGLVNPDWHLSYFKFVGRVIGKAICDGHLLDAHFTRSFYKHILGLPVTSLDLEAIEPDYYKTLKMILDVPLDDLGLDLTFTAESNDFGEVKVVDLVPGGAEIAVTDSNKTEYVRLTSHHRMTSAIKMQVRGHLLYFFFYFSVGLAFPSCTPRHHEPKFDSRSHHHRYCRPSFRPAERTKTRRPCFLCFLPAFLPSCLPSRRHYDEKI